VFVAAALGAKTDERVYLRNNLRMQKTPTVAIMPMVAQ
jgi:hypothetical protein